uniref:Mediator of RNA polymerase II transcription subunit 14 n=4 Tax=Lygus hesperus TaxID=30085 RepID=A0A146LY05_LYGHE
MAPLPLEGHQTPIGNNIGQEGSRGGSISLAVLIEFIVQRTYHELTVLAELLPRKTDMERKVEIYNFSMRTRQLFVRLLALVKWANSASKVDKSAHIMAFLDKQSMLFVETADMLARMSRETLVHARLPNFHIPAAVEVLTTGSFSRLPSCIRDRIVPPDPITLNEKKSTLQRLNQVIQHRLVTGNLMPQMRNLKIESGRVTFIVDHEFKVSLTVMGDGPNIPWRLLDIDILVEDKETGDGKALVHSLQVNYIHQVLQARLHDHPNPLAEVYSFLHYFCQSLQLEVLYSQTLRLCKDRLDNHIHVDEYSPGKCLTISYWRELTSKDPKSELGYKLTLQVCQHDPARPLQVCHVPMLGTKDAEVVDKGVKPELVSMEHLLIQTIYTRTRSRLSELKTHLQRIVNNLNCIMDGCPAVLSVPVIHPFLKAEQLLITVDTHTGMLRCHVPIYDPPIIAELESALNSDQSKIPTLISELRYWIVQRRCEKTLQHLPATPHERLPLLRAPDHPMSKIGKHRMFIRLHKHRNIILIVELKEKEFNSTEMDYFFYVVVVKHSSIEDDPNDETIENEIPKMYLRVLKLIEFDSFVSTHGPFTPVDEQERTDGKRKMPWKNEGTPSKRLKNPAYFIPELAHVVALCDERIPFITLAQELGRRDIAHQGLQVEANATALVLKIVQMPPPPGISINSPAWNHLLKHLLSVSIRVHSNKCISKSWIVEFVMFGSPLVTLSPKEQGMRRPVYFNYDMLPAESVSKTVDALLSDWAQIVHLYTLVEDLSEYFKTSKYNISSLVTVKSYSYNKLVLGYGPERAATVTVQWNSSTKAFTLIFGGGGNCASAHSIMREQLEGELNRSRNLVQLIHLLNDTYSPLLSISKLPTIPQLGVHNNRPQVPVQTFTVIAESECVIRVAYLGLYCLEMRLRAGGLVAIRDAAFSRFDRTTVVSDFTPTPFLKSFLSKYVDESVMYRRRSQSEDDNPPSPVTLDSGDTPTGGGFLGRGSGGPGSPARTPGSQDPPWGGALRFQAPHTPPSNPHTPASPHTTPNISQSQFGSSPATSSFNLASPPSLPPMPHPSPGGGPSFPANSPSAPLHAPSPMPISSPGPAVPQLGHSPANALMHTGHTDGSPYPSGQSMASPGASNWPGSPGVPRQSPRPGISPNPALHSPTDVKTGAGTQRVLPQRSWAGAVPTLISHEALEILCTPSIHPQGLPGPELAPLERFLGCVFMKRQLQRFIQNDECLTSMQNSEQGVVTFKVDTLQCRVSLNPQHMESLHIKITPLPEHKDLWTLEELQILENFFESKAAAPPYKPNALSGFCKTLNVPQNVLKDFIQIMRLELVPALIQQQQFKWSVQWCLRIPPGAASLVPIGMAATVICRQKILFFLQLTRVMSYSGGGAPPPGMEVPSLFIPLVYDVSTNNIQLPDKRDPGPSVTASANLLLKRFSDCNTMHSECSIFPAVRDLLMNFTLPSEQQQVASSPVGVMMQSPAGMMHSPIPGQYGGAVPMAPSHPMMPTQ